MPRGPSGLPVCLDGPLPEMPCTYCRPPETDTWLWRSSWWQSRRFPDCTYRKCQEIISTVLTIKPNSTLEGEFILKPLVVNIRQVNQVQMLNVHLY